MADFSALKTSIQNYIKQNGNEEITGNLLQQILLSMVTTLGDSAINDLVTALNTEIANRGNADTELGGRITSLQGVVNGIISNVGNGYVYAGIATPSSTPTSGKVFYLALTAGTYTNFGATEVPQGINILKYNGSAWSLDSFLGLDDAPTQGSSNLVKSGGVLDSIIKDGSAFDLSAYNSGTTYADLSAALTALNALPAVYKKGGMSVKYVQTSDNKYVQARCMAQNFTTDVTQWQGVDDEPTAGSNNIVKSSGVQNELALGAVYDVSAKNPTGGPNNDGKWESLSALLSDANLNTLIPASVRKGGMSIKFVQSTGKYVQCRFIGTSGSSGFTVVQNWQGVDVEPEILSGNLLESGGTYNLVNATSAILAHGTAKQDTATISPDGAQTGAIMFDGTVGTYSNYRYYAPIELKKGEGIVLNNYNDVYVGDTICAIYKTDSNGVFIKNLIGFKTGGLHKVFYLNSGDEDIYVGICCRYDYFNYKIIKIEEAARLIDFQNDDNIVKQYLCGFANLDEYIGHLDPAKIVDDYGNTAKYKVIKVCGGEHVVINGSIIRLFILKEFEYNPTLDYTVSFATGESRRNTAIDMNLPSDARYICVQTVNYQGLDCNLTTITIDGYDIINKTDTKKLNKNFGSQNANKTLVIDNNGDVVPGEEQGSSVKDYFVTELNTTIDSVRALITEPSLVFPLVTDIHYKHTSGNPPVLRYQTFDNMIENMRYIAKVIPFDFVLNLGDNMTIPSLSDMDYMNGKFLSIGIPYYQVIGNHDVYQLNRSQIYRAVLTNVKYQKTYNANNDGDYYIDFDALGIRIIVLNTNLEGTAKVYSTYSAAWLSSALDNGKINILCEHLSCLKEHNYDLEEVSGSDAIKGVLQTFVNNGGELIELCGHTHADYAFTTPTAPWLNIFNGCQTFENISSSYPAFEKITGYTGELVAPSRTQGNATEDLWTIIIVRPRSKKINLVRFGAGNDREFTF